MSPSAHGSGTGPLASSSSLSSSQAIQIPRPPPEYAQRRRGGRYSKIPSPVSRSDSQAGPSSTSPSSVSSWSSPPGSQAQLGSSIPYNMRDPHLPLSSSSPSTPATPQRKDKGPATSSDSLPPLFPPSTSPLSPSMLASSSYTSVNLNSDIDDPDEPPRLITYTKHGQGFTWNDELFLPSYMIRRHGGSRGGKKKMYDGDFGDDEAVSVVDIFITDEEARSMMP